MAPSVPSPLSPFRHLPTPTLLPKATLQKQKNSLSEHPHRPPLTFPASFAARNSRRHVLQDRHQIVSDSSLARSSTSRRYAWHPFSSSPFSVPDLARPLRHTPCSFISPVPTSSVQLAAAAHDQADIPRRCRLRARRSSTGHRWPLLEPDPRASCESIPSVGLGYRSLTMSFPSCPGQACRHRDPCGGRRYRPRRTRSVSSLRPCQGPHCTCSVKYWPARQRY